MKTIVTFLSFVLITSMAVGQITLTEAINAPKANDEFDIEIQAGTAISERFKSGANVTWDFSGVSGSTATFTYEGSGGGSDPSSFPNANLAELASGGENYYNVSSSGMTLEGHYVTGVTRIIYNDKRDFIFYPMTYNDSKNGTFDGTAEVFAVNQTYDRSGTTKTVADGYGTLILPYDTVYQVLKVMNIIEYSDKLNGIPIGNYIDTITNWYNLGTNTIVATTSVSYAFGALQISQSGFISQDDFVNSVKDLDRLRSSVKFYPNPASDVITINNTSNDQVQLEIYNITGNLVHTSRLAQGQQQVDVSELNNGVYMLNYTLNGEVFSQRLVIGQ